MILMIVLTTILLMVYGSYMWHEGGSGKWWARPMLCFVLASFKALFLLNLWVLLYGVAQWGMLALFSYGISSPPHKFVVWMFKGKGADGNYLPVELTTRAICGFMWSLPALTFALANGHWLGFGVYMVFLTCANAYFGTRKSVKLSERGVGASVSCSLWV